MSEELREAILKTRRYAGDVCIHEVSREDAEIIWQAATSKPAMSEDEAVMVMANAMYTDSKRDDSGWLSMARQAYRALLARGWGK